MQLRGQRSDQIRHPTRQRHKRRQRRVDLAIDACALAISESADQSTIILFQLFQLGIGRHQAKLVAVAT